MPDVVLNRPIVLFDKLCRRRLIKSATSDKLGHSSLIRPPQAYAENHLLVSSQHDRSRPAQHDAPVPAVGLIEDYSLSLDLKGLFVVPKTLRWRQGADSKSRAALCHRHDDAIDERGPVLILGDGSLQGDSKRTGNTSGDGPVDER